MKFVRRRRESVEVNLTPLIDVVFLLLIFFMVSTTFETPQALQLKLPQSSHAGSYEASALTLSISEQGDYRIEGQHLAGAAELHEALASRLERAREQGLVIEADGRTAHAAVIAALDQAASLDIQRIRIATSSRVDSFEQAETP